MIQSPLQQVHWSAYLMHLMKLALSHSYFEITIVKVPLDLPLSILKLLWYKKPFTKNALIRKEHKEYVFYIFYGGGEHARNLRKQLCHSYPFVYSALPSPLLSLSISFPSLLTLYISFLLFIPPKSKVIFFLFPFLSCLLSLLILLVNWQWEKTIQLAWLWWQVSFELMMAEGLPATMTVSESHLMSIPSPWSAAPSPEILLGLL